MKKIIAILIGVSFLGASPVEIGIGAREQGMGGACVALSQDAMSVYWNPAGLSDVTSPQMVATHWMWQDIKDVMVEYLSFAHSLELVEGSRLGVGLALLSRWAKLEQGNPGYDMNTSSLFTDNTFEVSAAFSIYSYLKVGLTLDRHWITSELGGKSGLGFNLGLRGELYGDDNYHVYYGFLVRNIMAGYGDEKTYPQGRIGFGFVGFPIIENGKVVEHYLKVAVDLAEKDDINGNSGLNFHYYAGIEVTPVKYVSLRAGYNDLYQYSGGIGVRYSHFGVDYSYSGGYDVFGDAHRVALRYYF